MSVRKNIVSVLGGLVPVNLWHSLCGQPLVLPYYHMVSDEYLPHVAPIYRYRNVRQFTADVEFFLKHFRPVALADLLRHVNGGQPLPARAFLLTFDDGFREMAEIVAPILHARGVPAVFFINSAFVDNQALCLHQKIALLIHHVTTRATPAFINELKQLLHKQGLAGTNAEAMLRAVLYAQRAVLDEAGALAGLDFSDFLVRQKPYLSSGQIRSLLQSGFEIGGHSVDHPWYRDQPLAEQLRQTRESVDYVQQQFGLNYRAFAFPHSDAGVTPAFFERSFGDKSLEISFGTGGLVRNQWPRHFQRFSLEKTRLPARSVLAYQYARRAVQNRRYPAPAPGTPAP